MNCNYIHEPAEIHKHNLQQDRQDTEVYKQNGSIYRSNRMKLNNILLGDVHFSEREL